MKNRLIYLSLLVVGSLLMGCQKINPLTPPNPVVGEWRMGGWQEYHVPAWYLAATHAHSTDYILTPSDTIFGDIIAFDQGVRSFTLAADHTLREQYYTPNYTGTAIIPVMHTDTGRWSLTDTVVTFQVANRLFHQINYRYATGELVVNKVAQSGLYSPTGLMKDTVQVPYLLVAHYYRTD